MWLRTVAAFQRKKGIREPYLGIDSALFENADSTWIELLRSMIQDDFNVGAN
jgi:hypothetical protein